ncbi:MAG: DUF4390 domain-containing protein [Deltaproteobacteria bacterium]|nr:DUF4390 domain-containing protein [Deltaproteobacteria bacterium]MBW2076196.1 DUF4390 domain-containing protein [Deltaproteobacteria bacterium]MBW2312316.1 DUF4390 domain-containing protein [Deltaproteobacteria bacterium]RLB29670.1 MAG: DUF4390 domain-containing protein [Deltaproteobacteria bacterium]
MFRKVIHFSLVLLFFSLFLPGLSSAREARLEDVIVTNTNDHLIVYFNVEDCFTEDMNRAIMNGIQTTFTFIVKLYEVRNAWFDRKVADIRLTHKVEYNTLKNEFHVSLPEHNDEKITTKDAEEANKLMAEVVALKVARLDKLRRGSHYQLRLKAELDKIELPFYLDYVLFFLSLWDFETDWYSVVFKY